MLESNTCFLFLLSSSKVLQALSFFYLVWGFLTLAAFSVNQGCVIMQSDSIICTNKVFPNKLLAENLAYF